MNYRKKLKQRQQKKKLTNDLINRDKIYNGARYFSSGILQSCLEFISAEEYFKFFTRSNKIHGNRKI